jgi:hypothetical protein
VRTVPDAPLNERQLLLALLDRQLLLERARLSVPDALERMGGLQAQYAPSMYIGLWTRLEGFARADLDDALEQRSIVQGTLLRSTIHLVSRADYWPMAAAIRGARKAWWMRVRRETDPDAMESDVVRLREHLRGGPQRAKDIEAELGVLIQALNQWTELVRVPPSGTWAKRRADLYATAEDWIGRVRVSEAAGTERLVVRYLGAFGPAAVVDIASWAGIPKPQVQAAVDRMAPRLRTYGDLVDLADATLPDADRPLPVRFLPVWDALTLVHARRTGVLPEEHRSALFNSKNPQSFHTFMVDGRIAGTWKHGPSGIELAPFGKLSKAARGALDDEAHGLEALHVS